MATTRKKSKNPQPDPAGAMEEFFYRPDEGAVELGADVAGPSAAEADVLAAAARRDETEYLSFWLADELYALPVAALREIVRPMPVTEVPRTPAYVLGVVTLRGSVLPVFDLRIRLGLAQPPSAATNRILVVETDEGPAGILTDRVAGVVRFDEENLEATPATLGAGGDWIRGLLRREGQMLIVLDFESALRMRPEERA